MKFQEKKNAKSLFLGALLAFCVTSVKASKSELHFDDQRLEDEQKINILSFDGGGIRGLYSLYIAQSVEEHMGGGASLVDQANLLAGTSTGGIIAFGLSRGMSISEIIDIYNTRADDIFQPNGTGVFGFFNRLFNETYSTRSVERTMQDVLGTDTRLSELTKPVIVTSYDIQGGPSRQPAPFIIDSSKPEFSEVKIWEAARATSAAPTYFEPYYGFAGRSLVDGGVFANNPSLIATTSVLSSFDESVRGQILQSMHMISFGTGGFHQPTPRIASRDRGLLGWAAPISSLMMTGVSQQVESNIESLFGTRLSRLGGDLEREIALDAISEADRIELREAALAYVRDNPEAIDRAGRQFR